MHDFGAGFDFVNHTGKLLARHRRDERHIVRDEVIN